jgi:hypothetical protein
MIGGSSPGAAGPEAAPVAVRGARREVTLGERAWIAAVPCALVIVAGIVVLGPPLGHAFLAPGSDIFFPEYPVVPEPVEHARYGIALLGPLLLSAVVVALAGRRIRLAPSTIRIMTWTSQLATFVFLAACLAAQNDVVLHSLPATFTNRFFDVPTLLIAFALPVLLLLVLRRPRSADRRAAWVRETGRRRGAGMAIASLLTALWLVTGVDSETSIGNSLDNGWIQYAFNETFAVLDGRTPLVNVHVLYGQLSNYPAALTMTLFGATLLVWTVTMATISWCAMVAVYATFRRLARSSALALALYVPFVAVTYFQSAGDRMHRLSPAGIFSLWPIRYAGPYLVAWLLGRHLDKLQPRRAWPLFVAGGLVALNNPEFGAGAVLGTLVALACQQTFRSRAGAARLLGNAAGGLFGAYALVALLTVVRTGQLPRLGLLLDYPHLFGVDGWHLTLMKPFGFHLAAYVTFAAAIVVAVVRTGRRGDDAVLTGMLAWSGGFGLIAGSYYVGESEAGSMLALLSAWFFCLAVLVVAVARSLAARDWRRPTLIELTVLFGFGLSFNAIPQIPFPWSQVSRLQEPPRIALLADPTAAEHALARHVRQGERVAILVQLGNRVAYDLGLVNISPFLSGETIPTRQTMQSVIDATRAADVHKIFIDHVSISPPQLAMLERAGFTQRGGGLLMDTPR